MNGIETAPSNCPYCGEKIEFLVDCSLTKQRYIEDCEVCCRPIDVIVSVDRWGNPELQVLRENER